MIIKRLKYLAVCLLVLLNVVSTMGGSKDDYKYYISQLNSTLCLSFKNNRLTDCCKQDDMQRIYVYKTGPTAGIFHIKDYRKVLCYDEKRHKFKLKRRRKLQLCLRRHQRNRDGMTRGRRRYRTDCKLDVERLRKKGCELHETTAFGDTYISFNNNSQYLGLRKNRVQKHKVTYEFGIKRVQEPKHEGQRFLASSESSFRKIISHNPCRA